MHTRFSEDATKLLIKAGWFPQRMVMFPIPSDFRLFPIATHILTEFYGLCIGESGEGKEKATMRACINLLDCEGLSYIFEPYTALYQEQLYPLGELDDGRVLWAVGESGKIYSVMERPVILGQHFDEALENIILGKKTNVVFLSFYHAQMIYFVDK